VSWILRLVLDLSCEFLRKRIEETRPSDLDVPPHLQVDIFKNCVEIYWKYPSLRFISNLFACINDKFSNSSRKSLFEIVFCHILYVRLSFVSIWES